MAIAEQTYISSLLSAAAQISDAELAVTLQGLLTRRTGVRQLLQNVWKAEDSLQGVSNSSLMQSSQRAVVVASNDPTRNTSSSHAACPIVHAQPIHGPMTENALRAEASRFARFHSSNRVTSEHVLAAGVAVAPEVATDVFSSPLVDQLSELLEKSRLGPPPLEFAASNEVLPFEADTAPLFVALNSSGPSGFFESLLRMPDSAAATQLIEMAKIFMERVAFLDQMPAENAPSSPANPSRNGDTNGGPVSLAAVPEEDDGQAANNLLCQARKLAIQSSAKQVGTDHVLAAAVQLYPDQASQTLGPKLIVQLTELLDKSRLGPPTPELPSGAGLQMDQQVEPLLALLSDTTGSLLLQHLQELPDTTAAKQLIEMAKIFTERAG